MDKTCRGCGQTKPITDFYSHSKMADGHLNKCKECVKTRVKGRYDEMGGNQEYERERYQRPERKRASAEALKKHRKLNPEKYKARTAVGNAIRDGRLKRGTCEVCGSNKVQAHHHDYSKPLEVQWLCFKHHRSHAHGQVHASDLEVTDVHRH